MRLQWLALLQRCNLLKESQNWNFERYKKIVKINFTYDGGNVVGLPGDRLMLHQFDA